MRSSLSNWHNHVSTSEPDSKNVSQVVKVTNQADAKHIESRSKFPHCNNWQNGFLPSMGQHHLNLKQFGLTVKLVCAVVSSKSSIIVLRVAVAPSSNRYAPLLLQWPLLAPSKAMLSSFTWWNTQVSFARQDLTWKTRWNEIYNKEFGAQSN